MTFAVSEVSSSPHEPTSRIPHRILNRLTPLLSQGYILTLPFLWKSVEGRVNNVPTINNREINTQGTGNKDV